MTLEDSVREHRLYALQRARETGNVSATCQELRISRTLFYRWKRDFEVYGLPMASTRAGPRRRGVDPPRSRPIGSAR